MRILLPMDDSEYSQEALEMLIAQVQPRGTEVRVLHVVEPVMAYVTAGLVPEIASSTAAMDNERQKQAEALIAKAADTLRLAGFETSQAIESGDTKAAILDCAEKWPADLIILGSHGLKGIGRFLMGSVSEAVSRHAHCSVQIVRLRHPRETSDVA